MKPNYQASADPVRAFHEYHGKYVLIDRTLYFEDGATRDNSAFLFGREPPENPYELAKRKLIYVAELLKRATDDFNQFRQQTVARAANVQQSGYGLPPGPEAIQKLKELQTIVKARQKAFQLIQREVTKHEPPHLRERQQVRMELAEHCQQVIDELRNIKV